MKKWIAILLSLLLLGATFTACGAAKNDSATESTPMENAAADMEYGDGAGGSTYNPAAPEESPQTAEYGLKIVYSASLDIETLDFDKSYAAIIAAASEFGGYVSDQYTSGGYRYSGDRYNTKYASLTLRIPAARFEEFLMRGDSFGNVTSVSNSAQDITSQYIDTEARLSSLRAQEERLLAMLDRAGTLEELISLEEHLADVRYEIERYTSTLKTYENMVSYSTVTIALSEVSTVTNTSDTFGARLLSALSGSLRAALSFLQGLVIFIVYALPYAVVVGLLLLVVRAILRRRKTRRMNQQAVARTLPPAAGAQQPQQPLQNPVPPEQKPEKK